MAGLALLFQPITISFDLDDVRVMQYPVQHCRSQRGIAAEGLIPLGEGKIAGEDHGAAFISLGDDLEEVAGLVAGQG